ncbi:hypothetical protein FQA39_LY11210 [Lamprigera yunnana]|nr:hypothetical protein FQA39_LY11210 [Lamprigera yunnana]
MLLLFIIVKSKEFNVLYFSVSKMNLIDGWARNGSVSEEDKGKNKERGRSKKLESSSSSSDSSCSSSDSSSSGSKSSSSSTSRSSSSSSSDSSSSSNDNRIRPKRRTSLGTSKPKPRKSKKRDKKEEVHKKDDTKNEAKDKEQLKKKAPHLNQVQYLDSNQENLSIPMSFKRASQDKKRYKAKRKRKNPCSGIFHTMARILLKERSKKAIGHFRKRSKEAKKVYKAKIVRSKNKSKIQKKKQKKKLRKVLLSDSDIENTNNNLSPINIGDYMLVKYDNKLFLGSRSQEGHKQKYRSPTPRPTKIHIGHLTRSVTKEHIIEIFSTYGVIKNVEFPKDHVHSHLGRGYAHIEFATAEEADNAMKHMDGGQIDGQEITAAPILFPKPRPPPMRRSPMRRPPTRRTSPRFRRRSPLKSRRNSSGQRRRHSYSYRIRSRRSRSRHSHSRRHHSRSRRSHSHHSPTHRSHTSPRKQHKGSPTSSSSSSV